MSVRPHQIHTRARALGDVTPIVTVLAREGITGKSAKEMRAERQAYLLAQPLTVRCALCAWELTLEAGEALAAATAHRVMHHPELITKKGKRNRSFQEQLEAAQQKRRKPMGGAAAT